MRVTAGSFYNNIYGENNKINKQLFDVNKQISSGMKIQYAHDNPGVFIDTLRLDDEITTLTQVKSSAQSAYKFSTQTDSTIGDIVKTLETMKVKMVNAANDTQSDSSKQAIAKELRGLQDHLMTLANTSIGGQFLFSGTAMTQKPIDANGDYQGNDQSLQAFLGSGVKQKYNISGNDLFLGNESNIYRSITTNVSQLSLTSLYPSIMNNLNATTTSPQDVYITPENTIRDLMGDTDADTTNDSGKTSYFYIQGTKTNGDTFKQKISLSMDATVNDLMREVSDAYGSDQVDVTLNARGQIQITDKINGSSKLDFHMVGAVDFDTSGTDKADTTDISDLQAGTTDFKNVLSGSNTLYIKEFIKSGLTSSNPADTIQGLVYDQLNFTKDGAKLISNVAQITNSTNEYATASSKLVDVSGMTTVDGRVMALKGTNINGTAYDVSILLGTPSTFTDNLTGNAYNIYGTAFDDTIGVTTGVKEAGEGIPSKADEITYRQLMDIVNMAVTDSYPTVPNPGNDPIDYDSAITNANKLGKVSLTSDGKLSFEDLTHSTTSAELALYDTTTSSFFPPLISGNALSFQANNAITISDPKKNFFAEIDAMIKSIEEGKTYPDGNEPNDPRNLGIQNAIQKLDDLSDHVSKLQTQAGTYSQVLQASSDRSDLLIVSTKILQSDVVDTDIAEATLRMQQLSLNYQALLANISKVSQLSLVNYL
ncbi:flagellar biosynthesis protein FlgL [Sulfuricurvum sp.]|uniref:flagellin N-terminal helical domain-containing protein n=1 Tax=Sulfuricurvum sp. TaxID=2025608 RepID=UPI003BB0E7E7